VKAARILIVDDSDSTRRMYVKALCHNGYEVIEAANGAEGVRLARIHRPDVILMDIAMPVLDAWEAIRLLKSAEDTAAIPVVALTGHTTEGDREGALEAGFSSFLPKPCEPSRVLEEIRRFTSATEAAKS
jgi:CheY-like chemotaxis protein